ncbi:MAG: ATP-grasp domain-containing protein [Lachnospiraceae bacterium]|nr:ATP-grasp domain-containing protein [Lachnospiraceae bacterium]
MIDKVFILYNKVDVQKNQRFIEILKECLEDESTEFKVIFDDEDKDVYDVIGKGCLVVNRSRNEQIASRLEEQGAKVVNSSAVTGICNDKWQTYLWAKEHNIPVLDTYCGDEKVPEYPVVIKSLAGHGGSEVFLAHNDKEKEEYTQIIESRWGKNKYIIQPCADTKGRDIRVYVLDGQIVVAMCREASDGFKSNYSLGGTSRRIELNEKETDVVRRVQENMDLSYAGIDLIYDGDRVVLNEIEDAVGARMVYENTDIDIVKIFGDWMEKQKKMW